MIATLEYDIQAVKKKIHMEEIQGIVSIVILAKDKLVLTFSFFVVTVEMKNRRDIYTEEGQIYNNVIMVA